MENQVGKLEPVIFEEQVEMGSQMRAGQLYGAIGTGQKVFLSSEQFIGHVTKIFLNTYGEIAHLVVRTAGLFGRHKRVPLAAVGDVSPIRVLLTISREQFLELPGFKADTTIADDVDRALWNDLVLRNTDYRQIDARVRDGIIILSGHITTGMNQWRAETAARNVPGSLGMNSYLIPDDKLALEVAEAVGQIEQVGISKVYSKVENGLAVLSGVVSSTFVRSEIEQRVTEIPWVRGIINDISVPGMALKSEDQRFLQPLIGKELVFKDAVSATIRKVVIDPHNRRVVAVVLLGRFPFLPHQEPVKAYDGQRQPERLVVLPVHLILRLTSSAGFIRINSSETAEYAAYDPSRYISPGKDWLPPYPYCPDEVIFVDPLKSADLSEFKPHIAIQPPHIMEAISHD